MEKDKYRQRVDIFLSIILFMMLWFFYGGNYWNGDREVYELYYQRNELSLWGTEIGYGLLNLIFNGLGLSFQFFQFFISLITILLMFNYIKKFSRWICISIFLYFLLMFSLDYVLMRVSLAYAIALNGLIFLSENKRIKYLFFVSIAILFHQSAVLFLAFIFTPSTKLSIDFYKLAFISFLIIVFIEFAKLFGLVPSSVLAHLNYYSPTYKSIIFNISIHLLSILIFYTELHHRESKADKIDPFFVFIFNLNVLSVLVFFSYFQADVFVRFFRLLCFINILYFIHSALVLKRISYFALIYILLYTSYLLLYFIFPVAEFALFPMYEFNIFIKYLRGL